MSYFSPAGRIRFLLIDLLRGTSIVKVLNELRRQQYLPADELAAIQQKKLASIVEQAKHFTPFYSSFEDYHQLPVLSKDHITANFDGFINRSCKEKLARKTTGGSTASPFEYYTTKTSQSYLWAGILLSWETAGYKLGDKVVFFAGTSLVKAGWKYKLFYKLMNAAVFYASPLNNQVLDDYTFKLNRSKATVMYGYANAIAALAEYLNQRPALKFPHLRGIVTTAEVLTPVVRASIEKAFGVRVYDQYGCNEAGISAFECEFGKMHLINTRAAYEVMANGALISTDLSNEGFIMLRYNTNDLVQMSDESCPCKRGFPLIKSVVGRQADIVIDKRNNILHASFFGIIFSKDTSIKRYQLQYDHDMLVLNIHTEQEDPAYYNKYLELLRKNASFNQYQIKLNEPFVVIKNGKHKELIDNRTQTVPHIQ